MSTVHTQTSALHLTRTCGHGNNWIAQLQPGPILNAQLASACAAGNGTRFARHIDNTADDGRRLTLLVYLNPNWKKQHGGQLRLTTAEGDMYDIYPEAGRMAMFLSSTMPHEVMPTAVPRYSCTMWYYDALERAEAVANAKVQDDGTASVAARLAARNLVRDILAGGDTGPDQGIQVRCCQDCLL